MHLEYARVAIVEDKVRLIKSSLEQIKFSKPYVHHLNIEKKSNYQKDRASTLRYICGSLNDDDDALVAEYDTAQQVWEMPYVKIYKG
jgi:hypothetical protein